jgi:asparagine synthase (glutamine-hydrolysing)
MCGIAGFLSNSTDAAPPSSAIPLASLAHRGPDDSGWFSFAAANASYRALLLHRRLSILDLSSAGHQPMSTPDALHTIVFNGEVYNYRELREELEKLGCRFRTQTDTEVLLQAYVQWGSACLPRLIGMFAFAILDQRRRTLFLARDFFGIKPLYFVRMPQGFAFASEMKTLLDWLPLKRTVRPQRLYDYLRFGNTDHGADTLWNEISQVPAAHYLAAPLDRPQDGSLVRYWDLPDGEVLDISFDEAAQHVRALFLDNVRLHLRSDVPVGTTLSGGIDSSAIIAATRLVAPQTEIHAFSYIADDSAYSEEKWVDIAGERARAIVHKVRPQPGDLMADLEQFLHTQDVPFGSTSIYAQYRVFRHVQAHGIKVVLDGQGADELFAGYRNYIPARLSTLIRQGRIRAAWKFARRVSRLPGMRGRLRLWLQAGRLLMPACGARAADRWMLMPAWINARWFDSHGVDAGRPNELHQTDMMREELKQTITVTSLPALLRYDDRNSMAASVESRLPFLTPQFAEFILRLPEHYLLGNDGTSKNVFRQAMRGIVPDPILDRRDKIGFATPEAGWLRTLQPWVEATLNSEIAHTIPAFNVAALHSDWQAVRAGRARFDFRVWRWVNLIRWAERFNVDFGAGVS